MTQISRQKNEITEKLAIDNARIREGAVIILIDDFNKENEAALPRLQQENNDNLVNASKIVQTAEKLEKEVATMRMAMEKARDTSVQSERETQTASHKKESAELAADRANKELAALATTVQKSQNALLRDLSQYGIKHLALDTLDNVLIELTTRRDLWLSQLKDKTEIEKQLPTLLFQTQHQAKQIIQLDTEQKNQRSELDALAHERDYLTRERHRLFREKEPDNEELLISSLIDQYEKHLEDSSQCFNSATQELGQLKIRIDTIEKAMLTGAKKLKNEEAAFQARLGLFGFNDELDYQTACLPEEKRKSLIQQALQLTTEQTALDARHHEKNTLLKIEQQKKVTSQSRELLAQTLESLTNNLKELQNTLLIINIELKNNNELRRKRQTRAKIIDAQKRECSRWDTLHELVGSADGKKYRNFAQGLTFEMMVRHANRQLQK